MTHDLASAIQKLKKAQRYLKGQHARVLRPARPSLEAVRLLREMERSMGSFEKHVSLLGREWLDSAGTRVSRSAASS